MKRPHLDTFLAAVYPYYDLVVRERGRGGGAKEGRMEEDGREEMRGGES